ncbi:MAG: tetratricopeptide repeat protein [Caulobacterales bacterium]|nr:tetratricopeptide repeat protein [Caulobacterales bacterium]
MAADIAQLLNTPAPPPKREAAGAVERHAPFNPRRLEEALDPKADGEARKRTAKVIALLRRAARAQEKDDHVETAKLALKALKVDPDVALANQALATALQRLGHLSEAISFHERAMELDRGDPDTYLNLGLIAWKLDMLEGAERFFRLYCQMRPSHADGAINLAGVLRDQGKFDAGVEILRAHIYARPDDEMLWNALGAVLMEKGEPADAHTFFDESLRLKPDFARAWHNLSCARALTGDAAGSAEASEEALRHVRDPSDAAEMRYGLAQSLLGAGRVEEGWTAYEARLSPHYAHGTSFLVDKPLWAGEPLAGKRLLLIGEQGLGDEVLFMNVAGDLLSALGPDGALTLACERRLAPLFARSFPAAEVRPHGTVAQNGRPYRAVMEFDGWDRIDLWAPMATAVRHLRPGVESFPDRAGFMTPDPALRDRMRAQLAGLPPGLKVGLVWKSKLMSAKRAKYFSPFEQWRTVLNVPGVTFVNMQYGDVDGEIAEARERLGVDIHALADIDLMNDLDAVTALGCELDLVIGPMNASTNLAMAAGAPAFIIAHQGHWPLLGAGRLPWYPQARVFQPPAFGAWEAAMGDVAAALGALAGDRRAA